MSIMRYMLSPLKPWFEVVPYYVNYSCLTPKGAYRDRNGFYAQNPARRIRPGLMARPLGFSSEPVVSALTLLQFRNARAFRWDPSEFDGDVISFKTVIF